MATISMGERTGRRKLDHELPLVPIIDCLLCLIAFLLVTAVWVRHAKLDATTAGGAVEPTLAAPPKTLHVAVREGWFELEWRQGTRRWDQQRIPRRPEVLADGTVRFPELRRAIIAKAEQSGPGAHAHRVEPAVLHASNSQSSGELVAVLDALHAPARQRRADGSAEAPAFAVSFAAD